MLVDAQRALRDAVVEGRADAAWSLLSGANPRGRLAIHQRHYRASLVTGLLARFPATSWLVGSAPLIDAATTFVRLHPPAVPCIAEYGADFPDVLAGVSIAGRVPYLAPFARFDWALGRAALQVARPTIGLDPVAAALDEAGDAHLDLQAGMAYVDASWPIDVLMRIFLGGREPAELALDPEPVWLEVRGARGELRFERLAEPVYRFRRAIRHGAPLTAAVEMASAVDADFDAGAALASLILSEAVTACRGLPGLTR